MHFLHSGLQRPRHGLQRWQHRMRVHLLDEVHWNDLQLLRHWLHHLPHVHPLHNGLQRARLDRGLRRWQHRMHVYLLAGVHWNDLQLLRH